MCQENTMSKSRVFSTSEGDHDSCDEHHEYTGMFSILEECHD